MLVRKFECCEGEYGLGFKPMWVKDKQLDPLHGMGCAHDMLEHPIRGFTGAEGEFMAHGAMWWVRGEPYFTSGWAADNLNSPASHISAEFPDILTRVMRREETLHNPPDTRPVADMEDSFGDTILQGFSEFRLREEEDAFRWLADNPSHRFRVLGWMRRGYRLARKRFAGIPQWRMTEMFRDIEEKIDIRLKHAEEGQVLTVQADFKEFKVRTRCDYPRDY